MTRIEEISNRYLVRSDDVAGDVAYLLSLVDRYRVALEWYADEDHHLFLDYGKGLRLPYEGDLTEMQKDSGERAREALKEGE